MFKLYQSKNSTVVINLVISIFLVAGNTYSQSCPRMGWDVDVVLQKPIYKELDTVIVTGNCFRRMRECPPSFRGLKGRELKPYQPESYVEFRCRVSGFLVLGSYSLQDTVKSLELSKGIKLYPNPAYGGASVNFELNKADAGVYKVEVFDVSGKLIQSETVNIVFKSQPVSISTSPNWTKGTYLIRLSGTKTNSVHVGKLVLR